MTARRRVGWCGAVPAAALAWGLALFAPGMLLARQALPTAADPVLEARVNALAAELRCLVCQNQSLADSHAALAVDLKNQVREQMRAGRSEREIVDYMTARYGDFILYRPPFKATTWLLWVGPLLLVLGGGTAYWLSLRSRETGAAEVPLTEARRAAVRAWLDDDPVAGDARPGRRDA